MVTFGIKYHSYNHYNFPLQRKKKEERRERVGGREKVEGREKRREEGRTTV